MSLNNISFIVPAYNAEKTLIESIESIFNNNFELGDEVIIVNDASTDNTAAVISTLVRRYPQAITVLNNNKNKGCPATRNIGIQASKNPLIFNLDSDNILAPYSINNLKLALIKTKADIVTFQEYRYFIRNPKFITHISYCNPGWFQLEDLFAGHINPGPGGNFLYTKESWERVGHYWEYGRGLHEAWGFTFKQLASGSKVYIVPNTYYLHRHGHESLFITESKNKLLEATLLKKMIGHYASFFPQSELDYIYSNPNWYHNLATRPVHLISGKVGKNGVVKFCLYGYWVKIIKRIHYLFQIIIR